MMRLVPLLEAVPSPLPGGSVDMDSILSMLQNALTIGSGLPGILGAIFVVLVSIAIAIILISKYFLDENKRRNEAYLESKRLELEHNTNAQKLANDYAKAAGDLLGEEYRKDYERYCVQIANKDFSFLVKIAKEYHAEIALFLYNETIAASDRAARIIHIVTKR